MAKASSDIDFTPPKAVQQAAQKGLDLKDEFGGEGLREHTVDWARHFVDGKPIDAAQARRMRAWFHRHKVDRRDGWDNPPTPGYVAWLLWGGDHAETWAEDLVAQVEDEGGSDAPLASAKHPPDAAGGKTSGTGSAAKQGSKKKAGKKASKKKAGKKASKTSVSKKVRRKKAGKKVSKKKASQKKAGKRVSKKKTGNKVSKKKAEKKTNRKKAGNKAGKKKAGKKKVSKKATAAAKSARSKRQTKASAGSPSGGKKARVRAAKAVNMRARR